MDEEWREPGAHWGQFTSEVWGLSTDFCNSSKDTYNDIIEIVLKITVHTKMQIQSSFDLLSSVEHTKNRS